MPFSTGFPLTSLKPEASNQIIFHKFRGKSRGPHTIYPSKVFGIVKAHLPDVHAYTDDTQLYLSFKLDSEDNQTKAVDAVQECIEDIRAWMVVDQLKLNEDKTEVILIGRFH